MSALSTLLLLAALAAPNDAVLVEFSSSQCGACRLMEPTVARLVNAGYPVQKINLDQQPQYGQQFKIQGVPTYVMIVKGHETERLVGAASYDKLVQLFGGTAPTPTPVAARPEDATLVRGQSPQPELPAAANARPTAYPASQTSYQVAADATASNAAMQRAMAATVRLKVEDATGIGCGTGTIIDVHESEALIVTCGHLFRTSQGKGKITVELFAPGATGPLEGQLLTYDLDRDIALLSVRPGMAIEAAQVAPEGFSVRPRDAVFSIGCDKGADPTVRPSQLRAVNKFQGPPNFTVAGQPVDGRSGGGLFSAEGYLIGICNAADPQDDEGLYAALGSIHWQLDQMQLSEIHRRAAKTPLAAAPAAMPTAAPAFATPTLAAQAPSSLASEPSRFDSTARSGDVPHMPARMPGAAPGARSLAAQSPGVGDDDTEIIVIVRSRRNAETPSQVYTLDDVPAELLAQLAAASRPHVAPLMPRSTSAAQFLGEPAVVRGQSSE